MSEIKAPAGEKGNFGFIILICLVATLGGFLFGFDSGVINGTVKGLDEAFGATNFASGFNVASMLLGCAVGAFTAGWLSDKFGRRNMMMVAAVFFLVSAWGSGIATSSGSFIIYRIIGGLAVGAASVMAPTYISEIAPARLRGGLASLQQIAIVVGLTAAFFSNYYLAGASGGATAEFRGTETWRWMFWVEIAPAALFLVLLFFIPKSPRYLMAKDDESGARKTLNKLFGGTVAERKIAEIKDSFLSDHKPRLSDLFNGGKLRPIVWVGIGLAVFQQLVGINVIFYYGAVMWEAAGFTEADALKQNVFMGVMSIFATGLTVFLIDKFGRKPFLMIGSIGMAIMLAVVAWSFGTGELVDGKLVLSDSMGRTALYAAMAYVFFFNMTWGPVMWVLLGEMFPNQIRGSALAVAGLSQWLANFVVTITFPWMLANLGLSVSFFIYSGFAFISILFVKMAVNETKGKELEEMIG
jgi:SP family sugar:H+ symporter-like MFS transporter